MSEHKRYRMVWLPCPATHRDFWNRVLVSADSILRLWELAGWRGEQLESLAHDQEIGVIDGKTGAKMTEAEYAALVRKLKNWD